jgi:hypothetical protein
MFIGIPEVTDSAHMNRKLEILWNSQSAAMNIKHRSYMDGQCDTWVQLTGEICKYSVL